MLVHDSHKSGLVELMLSTLILTLWNLLLTYHLYTCFSTKRERCHSIGLPVCHVSMRVELVRSTWFICRIMVVQLRFIKGHYNDKELLSIRFQVQDKLQPVFDS